MKRLALVGLGVLVLLWTGLAGQQDSQVARGAAGAIATSSPSATAAALQIMTAGGNAVDAAAAAHFALMVTDPANTSLGGRVQILIALADGPLIGVDGATQAPHGVTPLGREEAIREGYQVVPIPGVVAALAQVVSRHGRLPLREIVTPAIALARDGFIVTPRLATSWARARDALARDAGAAANFLKADGAPYAAGDRFRQPRLALVLEAIATSGAESFYRGATAEAIVRDVGTHGGFISRADLEAYRPVTAPVVRTTYRGHHVAALGGRAWGDTLVQMFNMLEEFSLAPGALTAGDAEILARVMGQALADRPQEIGTLKPKPDGYALSTLSSRRFARIRAAAIAAALASDAPPPGSDLRTEWHDTTHLAVMDRDGNAVSLTTSIGPTFGSRVATPSLGFLYAHSYRMRADPTPDERDETEMTPTVILRDGRPVLAIGAAGSERIPTAILQVASHVIDRHAPLQGAIGEARLYSFGRTIRAQPGVSPNILDTLRRRGFALQVEDVPLGTVHAVQWLPRRREFVAAADPAYDGTAAAPK